MPRRGNKKRNQRITGIEGNTTVIQSLPKPIPSPQPDNESDNSDVASTASSVLLSSSSSLQTTSNAASTTASSSSICEKDVTVVEKPVEKEDDPLNEKYMEDVLVTETARNPLSGNRKSVLTKLHSIGDIPIGDIGVRSLKSFCARVGIVGQRKKTKKDVADKIVEAKTSSFVQLKDRKGKKELVKVEGGNKRVVINRRRLLNVIFSDMVRPKLAEVGATLTKAELDKHMKQDQHFHETVASEYNKKGVIAYDKNAFPRLLLSTTRKG